VGDDLRSDVLAAQRAGLRAVLVRTGKGASFASDPRAERADAILDSVADLPGWLALDVLTTCPGNSRVFLGCGSSGRGPTICL
jgi:hypothetical protein